MATRVERNKVFISYSHKDVEWLELMMPFLKHLERDYGIAIWNDTKIKLGTDWKSKIRIALNSAKVAICLVSQDFISSDFIRTNELPPLLEAAEKNGAIVIPIIVRPCTFEESPLARFQAVNPPTQPLTALTRNEQEILFLKLSREIVEEFGKEKQKDISAKNGRKPVSKMTPISTKSVKPVFADSRREMSRRQIDTIDELRAKFRDADRRKFTFLLIGRMGVGKSSTINSLLGKKVSRVGVFKKTTDKISRHDGEIQGIHYSIVDTPGLADPNIEIDRIYLNDIKRSIRRIDCMLFVTPLIARVEYDVSIIQLVCEVFGKEIWDRTVVVFTFSDLVRPEDYDYRLEKRSKFVKELISNHTGSQVANSVPAVAVCNDEKREIPLPLPNGDSWLGELYTQVFLRISEEAAIPFFLATMSRIRYSQRSNSIHETQKKRAEQTIPLDAVGRNYSQTEKPPKEENNLIQLNRSQQVRFESRANGIWETLGKLLGIGAQYVSRRGISGVKEDFTKLWGVVSGVMKKLKIF